ncbi:uncharacterized protein LOC143256609 [Tachypleus tridentatus]|uniref:uncharacterized protein LOC143256609 n=1 Tax=Tachypleus tridentatus TaxID=6853 RepID=UPI003FD039A2
MANKTTEYLPHSGVYHILETTYPEPLSGLHRSTRRDFSHSSRSSQRLNLQARREKRRRTIHLPFDEIKEVDEESLDDSDKHDKVLLLVSSRSQNELHKSLIGCSTDVNPQQDKSSSLQESSKSFTLSAQSQPKQQQHAQLKTTNV